MIDDVNYLAIVVAAVAAFVASSAYYMLLGQQLAALSSAYADTSRPPAWKVAQEPLRNLIVASVVAGLASSIEISDVTGGLLLALALWIAFPAMLLAGSIIHENVPWKLAAIHAGDWLMKLVVIGVIVGVWR
jgi:hypothetical protein